MTEQIVASAVSGSYDHNYRIMLYENTGLESVTINEMSVYNDSVDTAYNLFIYTSPSITDIQEILMFYKSISPGVIFMNSDKVLLPPGYRIWFIAGSNSLTISANLSR